MIIFCHRNKTSYVIKINIVINQTLLFVCLLLISPPSFFPSNLYYNFGGLGKRVSRVERRERAVIYNLRKTGHKKKKKI